MHLSDPSSYPTLYPTHKCTCRLTFFVVAVSTPHAGSLSRFDDAVREAESVGVSTGTVTSVSEGIVRPFAVVQADAFAAALVTYNTAIASGSDADSARGTAYVAFGTSGGLGSADRFASAIALAMQITTATTSTGSDDGDGLGGGEEEVDTEAQGSEGGSGGAVAVGAAGGAAAVVAIVILIVIIVARKVRLPLCVRLRWPGDVEYRLC